MTDPARQRKIEEIQRTGKTWQWPDPVPHPRWTADHKVIAGWMLLSLTVLGWLIWWLASRL